MTVSRDQSYRKWELTFAAVHECKCGIRLVCRINTGDSLRTDRLGVKCLRLSKAGRMVNIGIAIAVAISTFLVVVVRVELTVERANVTLHVIVTRP